MAQSFDPVFGEWYTEKQIGSGTDGKVYTIIKENEDGTHERSILKTIRTSANRDENKNYNNLGEVAKYTDSDDIVKNITDNIDIIRKMDGGKFFVGYEQWETRETSDGKGRLILIRLERMRSLADLLDEFSFTHDETVKLGISICKSLMRCRDFGYIYPNLKPENILFDKNGICKLGDFGTFSCLEPSRTSIAFKRTQYYMAPEFINSGKINCTVDTYSLGLVLYALTNRGRLPFVEMYPQEVTINGLDRSKMNRLNGVELPKPILASDALFAVISKACAYKEKDRYLSPKQMMSDLKNVLENKPFEKAEYDDIYSESLTDDEPGAEDKNSEANTFAEYKYEPIKIEEASLPPVQEEPVVSLKEEITIPDVSPMDYASGKKSARKRQHVAYSSLPEIKPSKKKKAGYNDVKKLIILAAAVLIVLVLLLISIALRVGSSAPEANSVTAMISQNIILFTGGIINGG